MNKKEKKILIFTVITFVILFAIGEANFIAFMILFVGLIGVWHSRSKRMKEEFFNNLEQEAKVYITKTTGQRSLPVVSSEIFLGDKEIAFFEENVALSETRSVRQSSGSGAGVRIAKGVSVGGYSGSSRSQQEWHTVDHGTFTITNQKIVFSGEKENRIVELKKIFNYQIRNGQIAISYQKKNIRLSVANPLICSYILDVIKRTSDPTNLSDSDFELL